MIKRPLDFIVSLFALIVISPIMIIIAVLVRINLGSPVVFRQKRPGIYGHPFFVYKFRTMIDQCNANGDLLPDEERLTDLGKLLRRMSLDELPQLFNVLKGDMSLVGPRPLLMDYLDRYTPEQARRHNVRPGITGWAQVNGRNTLLFVDRFKLDVWYVDNWSFGLDLKIIWMTFINILTSDGVNEGCKSMEIFKGTNDEP